MEEMPNLNPNQVPEEPDESLISRREVFSESWQRFRSRFSEVSIEVVDTGGYNEEAENSKHEKDNDDDEEDSLLTDSDDDNEDSGTSTKSKRRNLWSRQASHKSKSDNPGHQAVVASEEQSENPEAEEILIQISEEQPYEEAEINADEQEPDEPSPADTRLTPIAQVIRQRQQPANSPPDNERETVNRSGGSGNNGGLYVVHGGGGSGNFNNNNALSSNGNTIIHQHYHTAPSHRHGGLIALDILNYGLALRRDNKNKRLSDRKMQKLSDEVKRGFKRAELLSYSNNLSSNPTERVIYNNVTRVETTPVGGGVSSKSVEVITTEVGVIRKNNEQISTVDRQTTQNHYPESAYSYGRSIESDSHKLRSLEIQNQLAVNQRDSYKPEIKVEHQNAQDLAATNAPKSKAVPFGLDASGLRNMKSTVGDKIETLARGMAQTKPQANNDFKQYIGPSISGIIAGIIVFIILYMLTMR